MKKRVNVIKEHFFGVLEAVVGYLRAGMSVERAFEKVMADIELLYGKDSDIYMEFENINTKVELDIKIEDSLKELAERINEPSISEFAELYAISRRRDGNIINVIESMCGYIKDEIEMNRDIRLSINNVLQEISIMKIMPVAIILYLKVCSNDYISIVYKSATGYIVMAGILIIYLGTLYITDKMKQKVLYGETGSFM
jgi:Flp pilus assembly protein TadB